MVREIGEVDMSIIADYCSLTNVSGWEQLALFMSMENIVWFGFRHYSISSNTDVYCDDESWRDVNFQCINQVMRAIEKNKGTVELDYQPYYHPMFHNINLKRFGSNKVTMSVTLIPHTYRYGYFDTMYNSVISGFHKNQLEMLDLSEGLPHPDDFCLYESLYPTLLKVKSLKLIIAEGLSIPPMSMIFGSPMSRVQEVDISFDGGLEESTLREFGEIIRGSPTLRKLRITIPTDSTKDLCRMLKTTDLRECVVFFVNDLSYMRMRHLSPRANPGVSLTELSLGVHCLDFARLLFSDKTLSDVILSKHGLCVEVEYGRHWWLEEACSLNKKHCDNPYNCAVEKCALSCSRRKDFDASTEMGVLRTSMVLDILFAIARPEAPGESTTAEGVADRQSKREKEIDELSSVYKILRHRLASEVFESQLNKERSTKRKF
jgi:hypothetical protein